MFRVASSTPALELGAVTLELAARRLQAGGHLVEGGRELADLVVGAHRDHLPRTVRRARDVAGHPGQDLDRAGEAPREQEALHQRQQQAHHEHEAAPAQHAVELAGELGAVRHRDDAGTAPSTTGVKATIRGL